MALDAMNRIVGAQAMLDRKGENCAQQSHYPRRRPPAAGYAGESVLAGLDPGRRHALGHAVAKNLNIHARHSGRFALADKGLDMSFYSAHIAR
ncbi:hypothetical protein [Rhodoblastus sp.]|uniref:hypothetical protein n=1 Tax=Rhodoblastus sp. TaxID=1962975 RepID=UPI0025F62248|nr:hypothetical protein [Rhodoblastus sp.]